MHQSPNSTGGGDVGSGGGGAGSGPMPGAGMPNFRYHQKNKESYGIIKNTREEPGKIMNNTEY